MDFRKLIKFGNSSHVISIPKDWITKQGLQKGDVVYFSENENNELVLASKEREEKNQKSIVIDIKGKEFEDIKRGIFSKYIAGYDKITLIGEKEIRDHEERLRHALENLSALEIVEQTKSRLVAKDFIDSRAISIEATIKRIDILIRSMLEDLKTTYKEDHGNLTRRDRDVNKLANLMMRTIKKASEDTSVQKKIGLAYVDMLKVWDTVRYLELFADELKRVARYLGQSKVSAKKMNEFITVYEEVEEMYKKMMNAWYENNEKKAYEVAGTMHKIMKKCDELVKEEKNIPFSHAVGKLKVMETFIRNIARATYELSSEGEKSGEQRA